MDAQQSQAILAALSPEILAERQRIVDAAVRAARNSGHCDTFNSMLATVLPEMTVTIGRRAYAFNTEGTSCSGYSLADYHRDNGRNGRRVFDAATGYDQRGFDRDGFNIHGYDADGYDAEGRSSAYLRERVPYAYDSEVGRYIRDISRFGEYDRERVYLTGYGQQTGMDVRGNLRVGRPATEAEAEAEAVPAPDEYNPTTWKPTPAEPVKATKAAKAKVTVG